MLVNHENAAKLLNITPKTLRVWRRNGIVPQADTKRPGTWYDKDELDSLVAWTPPEEQSPEPHPTSLPMEGAAT